MKSARDEFGPPRDIQQLLKSSRIKDQVQGIGNDLKQAGVKQDGHANLDLVKNNHDTSQAAKKDMTVQQGDRPALSPCDGNMQAREAGQGLHKAGVAGGQTQSAAQQFAPPAQTPSVPPPSVGGRSM